MNNKYEREKLEKRRGKGRGGEMRRNEEQIMRSTVREEECEGRKEGNGLMRAEGRAERRKKENEGKN